MAETARRLFDAAFGDAGGARLAIVDSRGAVVHATKAADDLFGTSGEKALHNLLLGGDGPSARRLRWMASVLPVGETPRRESLRLSFGRISRAVTLVCARVPAPGGAVYLVIGAPGEGRIASAGLREPVSKPVATQPKERAARSRFLWTIGADGRFRAGDPILELALGAQAPVEGETLEDLRRRAAIGNAEELASALSSRETFADLAVAWPTDQPGRRVRVALSGAPFFDRERAFGGYRGFGVLGETLEAAGDSAAAADEANAPSGLEGPEAAEPQTATAALGSPERTAEIYVLRQGGKVVPIRPGALDGSPPHAIRSAGGEGVELSRSERDAFREIARALVGRTPPSRAEATPDSAPEPNLHANEKPQPPAAAPPLPSDIGEENALAGNLKALLDRLPIGVLIARDARALYANQTLLTLLRYPDLEHFQNADGLASMFRGDDAFAISADGAAPPAIVRSNGEPLAVEVRMQAIQWDGAPATMIALEKSPEANRDDGPAAPAARDGATRELQQMLDGATDGAATLDSAGRILSLNGPAERLFGYREADIRGESVLALLAPTSHPEAPARVEA